MGELLVILALLALMAVLLWPVFGQRKSPSARARCSSNLKQLSNGFLQYAEEYDSYLPPVATCSRSRPYSATTAAEPPGCGGDPAAYHWPWMQAVFPFIKTQFVFHCGADNRRPWEGRWSQRHLMSYGYNHAARSVLTRDYGWCTENCGIDLAPWDAPGAQLEKVADEGGTILLCDSGDWLAGPGDGRSGLSHNVVGGARHGRYEMNCVFVDGHVKAMGLSKIIDRNDRAVWRWWTSSKD